MKQHLPGKIIITLVLAFCLAGFIASAALASITFKGKIDEIRKANALGLGEHEIYFVIKLDSEPYKQFRMPTSDALSYGIIDQVGNSQIVTPKQSKGLGWKVKLECDPDPTGSLSRPVYRVKDLERLDD
jgi:hypothetical protein